MIKAKVVGRVWATKRITSLPQGALLRVETEDGTAIIAFDPLGCGEGEEVLITQGSVAASYFDPTRGSGTDAKAPVDALIIGSIDDQK